MSEGIIPGSSSIVDSDGAQRIDIRLLSPFLNSSGLIGVDSTFTHIIEPDRPIAFNTEEIVFNFPNTATAFADLKNTDIYICGELVKRDGSRLTATDEVLVANNFLSSLFESVTVYLGKNQVELYTGKFPFKSFIRQLLDFKFNSNLMRAYGMNVVINDKALDPYENNAGRFEWTSESKKFELMGKMKGVDFFNTVPYLLPSTPLKLKFRKSNEPFYVITSDKSKDTVFNFNIEEMKLFIPSIQCSPALSPLLEMGTDEKPASYPFSMLEMRRYSLNRNVINKTYRRIYENKLPAKLLFGFWSQDAFSGKRTEAAMTTYDLDIRKFIVYINGVAVRTYTMNYAENVYLQVYNKFLTWMGVKEGGEYFISYDTFKKGYRYICIDFLENCHKCDESQPITQGYLDVEVNLGEPCKDDIIMGAFSLSNEEVQIDKLRNAKYTPTIV